VLYFQVSSSTFSFTIRSSGQFQFRSITTLTIRTLQHILFRVSRHHQTATQDRAAKRHIKHPQLDSDSSSQDSEYSKTISVSGGAVTVTDVNSKLKGAVCLRLWIVLLQRVTTAIISTEERGSGEVKITSRYTHSQEAYSFLTSPASERISLPCM
jgi:hypothetical protein